MSTLVIVLSIIGAMALTIFACFVGGYIAFKAANASTGASFVSMPKIGKDNPHSYVAFDTDSLEDVLADELSPAAARLRGQKFNPENDVLRKVMGK